MKKLYKSIPALMMVLLMLFQVACGTPSSSSSPASTAPSGSGTAPEANLNWPDKTVHIVVTFSAGGGNDLIARAVAASMETLVSQSVVAENITGAGGMTGSNEVVTAAGDGYTILCQDASLTSMLVTQAAEVPFTLDDLIPVASVYTCPTWAVSNTERGYSSLQDFVDAAKAHPGELTIGTAVTTGSQYLMACAIVNHFDLDVTIIPYAGGNELKAAVLGNMVDMGVVHSPIMLPEVQEGLANVLVAGSKLTGISDDSLKNTKTLADYGMNFEFTSTRGFLVPVGTPPEVVKRLEGLLKDSVSTNVMATFAESFGYAPSFLNQEEYTALLKKEMVDYGNIFNQIS